MGQLESAYTLAPSHSQIPNTFASVKAYLYIRIIFWVDFKLWSFLRGKSCEFWAGKNASKYMRIWIFFFFERGIYYFAFAGILLNV